MKIALFGAAGFLGRAAAVELSRRSDVGEIILVDYVIRDAKRIAKVLSPRCRWAMADVGHPKELARLLEGIDAAANAVGPCAEYEKPALLACAAMGISAASIGDAALSPADRDEIHAAFRAAGAAAVSGCGMMPGWTELLAAHFLGDAPRAAAESLPDPLRYLYVSPDRFGGYGFLRRFAHEAGGDAPPPEGAPAGRYFTMRDGTRIGVPEGTAGRRMARFGRTVGRFGAPGREIAAALMLWFRPPPRNAEGEPAAVAGVVRGARNACVEDPRGSLAAHLLVETAVRLGSRRWTEPGLLPLQEVIGKTAAEGIAAAAGANLRTG